MKSKQFINKSINHFYTKVSEETRLDKGMGLFEFERTKSLIAKYLPATSSCIIDVGGGTGKYSAWLAQKEHKVHMVEPVDKHIKIALKRANKRGNKFHVHQGESRKLEFPNNFADLIILHGPLYHLQKKEDRELTVREAKRVLKNNGIVLGFAINYTASTLAGLLNGLIHKKSLCKEELTSGIHNPPLDFPWLLAEAYYHNPPQLEEEFLSQGFIHLNTHAVEGMAWLDKNYFANMENSERRKTLLELIQLTEKDGNLLPFSPHMMIAIKKKSPYEK